MEGMSGKLNLQSMIAYTYLALGNSSDKDHGWVNCRCIITYPCSHYMSNWNYRCTLHYLEVWLNRWRAAYIAFFHVSVTRQEWAVSLASDNPFYGNHGTPASNEGVRTVPPNIGCSHTWWAGVQYLLQVLTKSRCREIWIWSCSIAQNFDRHVDSACWVLSFFIWKRRDDLNYQSDGFETARFYDGTSYILKWTIGTPFTNMD